MDLQAQLILKDGSLIEFKSRLSEEGELAIMNHQFLELTDKYKVKLK